MIKSLEELDLKEKRVFVRVDFNVPYDAEGKVADDSRIVASLPTIRHVLKSGGKLILASHLGRPKGKRDPKYSLMPVAARLSELLEREVTFPEDCIGDAVKKLVGEMREGEVILLENLRFHPEEEVNDPIFSERLAGLADIYVNDAFGTLHRAHASTVGMVPLVKDKAAGLLVLKEVQVLSRLLHEPARPFVAILGGAKVSDKLGVIENLLKLVDGLLIGGAMAYTFLKAKGVEVGASLVEDGKLHQAAKLLERAKTKDIRLELPLDHVIARELKAGAEFKTPSGEAIPAGWMGLDVGPKTLEAYEAQILAAKTVLWNGPVGAFETPPFERGTVEIARTLAKSAGMTVVGGGDSLAAVKVAGVGDKIGHLSTGGGATLEFLEGKTLPGLKALETEGAP
ncbi:phosphoglycerate kinase [Deltaproteobacteria bacterium PRO3]|nr:phosphoglycerate kinase [Deltaproteobacteria bacterium PRO3]